MPTVVGTDKRGHRYKSIDGKRVSIGDGGAPQPRSGSNAGTPDIADTLQTFIKSWLKGADSPDQIKSSIGNMLASKFRLWFLVAGKTAVGKAGRLYAARQLLEALGEKPEDIHRFTSQGDLDGDKFVDHLESLGVDTGEDTDETEDDSDTADSDQAILQIVRSYGLNAESLKKRLDKSS